MSKHNQLEKQDKSSNLSRSDLRGTLEWIVQNNTRTIIVAIFFLVGGVASFLGHLRWQHAFFRISFALGCWLIVFVILVQKQKKRGKSPNQSSHLAR